MTLTIDQLDTKDARLLLRHLTNEISRLERRIASQNKAASRSMLPTHEEEVMQQRLEKWGVLAE
jgi:hypothetical protein